MAGGVHGRAGIGIAPPRSADSLGGFEHRVRETCFLELDRGVEADHPGTDDDDIEVRRRPRRDRNTAAGLLEPGLFQQEGDELLVDRARRAQRSHPSEDLRIQRPQPDGRSAVSTVLARDRTSSEISGGNCPGGTASAPD